MPTLFPMIMQYLKKNWAGIAVAIVAAVGAKYIAQTFFPNTVIGGAKKKKKNTFNTDNWQGKSSSSSTPVKTPTNSDSASALKERNDKFGSNSYYYAHSKKYGDETTVWDGNAAPRLLSKSGGKADSGGEKTIEKTVSPGPQKIATAKTVEKAAKSIEKYAFSDEGAKVKVYMDLEGVGQLADEAFKLEWGVTNLSLRIQDLNGSDYQLQFKHLCGTISGAKIRKKPNKIILTLDKKEKDTMWYAVAKKKAV